MAKSEKSPISKEWPPKAHNNPAFLNSRDGRAIRVLCEFTEPERRFRRLKIKDTIVFFGSSRTLSRTEASEKHNALRAELRRAKRPSRKLRGAYEHAKRDLKMSRYYEDAMALAERLTRWSRSLPRSSKRFIVCSGGGPGIMEAANRGALKAGGPSIGLSISLPFEQGKNPYQTKELAFEFHYFFIRKFWFVYLAKALVVFPGGFGTMDELFELLTIVQTEKTAKYMPIVVFGTEYWNELVDFDAMVKWGMIDREDLNLFRFFDDVDSAFHYLKEELTEHYLK